jgi:hypothetical protein
MYAAWLLEFLQYPLPVMASGVNTAKEKIWTRKFDMTAHKIDCSSFF